MKSFYDFSSVAEASYVEFHEININNDALVEYALQPNADSEKDLGGIFSSTQAGDFVSKWRIVSHTPNTDNGYSSTVFKSKENGKYIISFRGTDGGLDIFSADIGDIVADGLAIKQIVDLYNDIQKLTAGIGDVYSVASLVYDDELSERLRNASEDPEDLIAIYTEIFNDANVIVDRPGLNVYRIEKSFVTAQEDGALCGVTSLSAAGHSLGGHLASAASRLFPGLIDEVVTINGAGFSPDNGGLKQNNISHLFSFLGGESQFRAEKIHNIYGERGVELTTQDSPYGLLAQPGRHTGIYIETGLGYTFGHGVLQMTDSLALYDLFIKADIHFQSGNEEQNIKDITEFFDGISRNTEMTLERMLNAWGGLLVEGYAPVTSEIIREDLYSTLGLIHKAISGKTTTVISLLDKSPDQIAELARNDISVRYALVHLNPFAVRGDDGLYQKFNKNMELALYDPQTGKGLTDEYLQARSKMLYLENKLRMEDKSWAPTDLASTGGYYEDRGAAVTVNNVRESSEWIIAPKYIFGSDQGDSIETLYDISYLPSNDDHIFGGGDDVISGNSWNKIYASAV